MNTREKLDSCKHAVIRHEPQTVDGKVVLIAVVCAICNTHMSNITVTDDEHK